MNIFVYTFVYTFSYKQPVYKQLALGWQFVRAEPLSLSTNKNY